MYSTSIYATHTTTVSEGTYIHHYVHSSPVNVITWDMLKCSRASREWWLSIRLLHQLQVLCIGMCSSWSHRWQVQPSRTTSPTTAEHSTEEEWCVTIMWDHMIIMWGHMSVMWHHTHFNKIGANIPEIRKIHPLNLYSFYYVALSRDSS